MSDYSPAYPIDLAKNGAAEQPAGGEKKISFKLMGQGFFVAAVLMLLIGQMLPSGSSLPPDVRHNYNSTHEPYAEEPKFEEKPYVASETSPFSEPLISRSESSELAASVSASSETVETADPTAAATVDPVAAAAVTAAQTSLEERRKLADYIGSRQHQILGATPGAMTVKIDGRTAECERKGATPTACYWVGSN